jgi:formylmethanofuran--tetrahydromethanopterin N-formyltransferase
MSKIEEGAYAEAFQMKVARLLITAATQELANISAQAATGFGVSIIASPAEAGMEGPFPDNTPDGRPGRIIQIWHVSKKKLKTQLLNRIGQCILTAPTTAVFDALEGADETYDPKIRFFGDGFQQKTTIRDRAASRVPVMDGEFIIENEFGIKKGVAGGNLIIIGKDPVKTLEATEAAVKEIQKLPGVVMTFPGGICRSGSKVGSLKYSKFLHASTNHRFCPTLREKVEDTLLSPEVGCVYEIVLNGLDEAVVKKAMQAGAKIAAEHDAILKITAANYEGKLGQYKISLT